MNFVLIPGAWMGEWVWEPVSCGLRSLGHHVHPITLSGLADEEADVSDVGLETHVDDVLSILESKDLHNAVVVGHSYSGIVAGQIADRAPDRVSHTVFIDAFLPHDGKAMLDAFSESQHEDELAQIAVNAGRWPAPDLEGAASVAGGPGAEAALASGLRAGFAGAAVFALAGVVVSLAVIRSRKIPAAQAAADFTQTTEEALEAGGQGASRASAHR